MKKKFLVFKETVVLRWWESKTWKFGFIVQVVELPPWKIRKADVSSVSLFVRANDEGLTLKTSAFQIFHGVNSCPLYQCKWKNTRLIKQWKEFVLFYPIFLKTPPFFISVIRLFYQFCFFSFAFKNYCCSVPSPGSSASFLLRSVLAFTFGPLSNHLIKANFHYSCLTMSSCAKRQTFCEFRKFKM